MQEKVEKIKMKVAKAKSGHFEKKDGEHILHDAPEVLLKTIASTCTSREYKLTSTAKMKSTENREIIYASKQCIT